MKTIHSHFKEIQNYLDHSIHSMKNYLKYSTSLQSHNEFNINLISKIETLNEIRSKISSISEYNLYNISKIKEIGRVLKYFYELHTSSIYEETIMYSIGFNGYIDCIEGLQKNIIEKKINFATFIHSTKKNVFKHSYYANLKNSNPIKNTIKLKKNLVVTGPNASGKTTILKSTLINIIFTQQFGCGFYKSAKLKPYKFIHCYLNIPDTSGRDSLFQAEARRCKEILDCITEHPEKTHLCIFDEIYSGTNPNDAVMCAKLYLKGLNRYKNKVDYMITTHYIDVCEHFKNKPSVKTKKMNVKECPEKLEYDYQMTDGISYVNGGIFILKQLLILKLLLGL
jgi:dsDNA-specific endonuclease/ATPase MutS2